MACLQCASRVVSSRLDGYRPGRSVQGSQFDSHRWCKFPRLTPASRAGSRALKYRIETTLQAALSGLPAELRAVATSASPNLERTRGPSHGDYATNIALQLAKAAGRKPRDLA